jgi:hypothetical protein
MTSRGYEFALFSDVRLESRRAGALVDATRCTLRVALGSEAARLSKAFATGTYDLPVIVAAVVPMDKELQ